MNWRRASRNSVTDFRRRVPGAAVSISQMEVLMPKSKDQKRKEALIRRQADLARYEAQVGVTAEDKAEKAMTDIAYLSAKIQY